jgi:diaminopimelate decarboxylase
LLVYKNKLLCFGKKKSPLTTFVKNYQHPIYLYDWPSILERLEHLQKAIPRAEIYYAMKANANEKILRSFRSAGVGLDVVSGGELKKALRLGFSPQKIIFSGVGKTVAELELSIKKKIQQINVESIQELERIGQIAKRLKQKANIAFRMNPDVDALTHPYITTGIHENKFGMEESALPELLAILTKYSKYLELRGLTMHIGSQLRDLHPLEDALKKMLPLYANLRRHSFALESFDVGGGLGISYTDDNDDLKMIDQYGALINRILGELQCRILCEPGRILVGAAGVLIARVEYIKTTPRKKFIVLDTGMHHLLRPALYQAHHRVLPLRQFSDRPSINYDIVGPICESSDVLGRNRMMSEVRAGEFLAIADVGAYGFTMASRYNEHELPKEILLK